MLHVACHSFVHSFTPYPHIPLSPYSLTGMNCLIHAPKLPGFRL
ncbi:MAG: hypothetical protein EWM73_01430 [Nitrospira sp.]|nr:MAG: hypothetical protein EWM73_01430 [Nitrospira sp.]